MSLLARLFARTQDPREQLRPLYDQVVAIGRAPHWYAREGVADTIAGRFDMIAAVLALVLLRMEQDEGLAPVAHHLTELFVADMDGQLRESGVGDLMVGKHVGKLMSALGGRLGAFRTLATIDDAALAQAVERNMTLVEGADPAPLAAALRTLHASLAQTSPEDILAGRIA